MKKYILLIAVAMGLSQTACKEDFIDLSPISSANINSFYQSEKDFETAIVGVYNVFQSVHSTMWTEYNEFRGDTYTHIQYSYAEISNNTFQSNTTATMWNTMYRMITYSNIILDRIDAVEMDEGVKARIKGEAQFFRAYAYFALVRIYGDVPLITKEVSTSEALEIGRTPTKEVYAQITMDLTAAIASLPTSLTSAEQGRLTKYAAEVELSRAYMTMSGYPLKENHWADAKPLLEDVINSGQFIFSPTYEEIFTLENEGGAEIILGAKFKIGGVGESTQYQRQFNPTYGGNPLFENGVYESFESGDIRRDFNIAQEYTTLVGATIEALNNTKFDYGYDRASTESGMDFPVQRYTDVLLMYAEVLAEVDGAVPAKSLEILNQVRTRAGLEELAITDLSQFRVAMQKERRSELMFECVRWFDLVRTEMAVDALKAIGHDANENWLLFPLPQTEIDKMQGVLKQNPGY
ncbi:SusD-like starch-binding protein associating with outer membrane [Dyadobacter jejuensis]|uniref:SusD-like starch-binding protein associating with outer membrane n=1 Tax=Dyadobacter jejuensis TaxID=1082580 RepID=A0A316AI24_9BACT|nr:RagB/SusD family nutrient uptake outer membrane protein [Dyadobacter jejuensis]PWJ56899.1 SusD-like starch-binding protein associating with outer membrane [Dyadobacter jejuensis]